MSLPSLLIERERIPSQLTSNPSLFSNCPATVGPNCQTNINECASNPCLNQGTCIDDVAGYKCNCMLPYTGMSCSCLYFTQSNKLLSGLFHLISCWPNCLHRSENCKDNLPLSTRGVYLAPLLCCFRKHQPTATNRDACLCVERSACLPCRGDTTCVCFRITPCQGQYKRRTGACSKPCSHFLFPVCDRTIAGNRKALPVWLSQHGNG